LLQEKLLELLQSNGSQKVDGSILSAKIGSLASEQVGQEWESFRSYRCIFLLKELFAVSGVSYPLNSWGSSPELFDPIVRKKSNFFSDVDE